MVAKVDSQYFCRYICISYPSRTRTLTVAQLSVIIYYQVSKPLCKKYLAEKLFIGLRTTILLISL